MHSQLFLKMTLTIENVTEFKALFGEAMRECVKDVLSDHGVTPKKYPMKMSTSEICELKGCSPKALYNNWKSPWGFECLGRNSRGEKVFSGLSVKRHIERENEKKGATK